MATSTFAAKITNLVGGTIDDDACDDWMTEGAKEIINQLPPNLLRLCTTNTTFTSQVAGSESSGSGNLLNTGKVLGVFAGNYACRLISNLDKYKAEDDDNVLFATATDPVYYIERSYINVLPAQISTSRYEEVQYPTINNGSDNTIALFPDEAEHLVVLYAAIRQLLQYQSTMSTSWNEDITTALTAVNTAVDRVASYNWDDSDTFTAGSAQLTRVKAALDDAEDLINGDEPSSTQDAYNSLANEDLELMSGALSIASTEIGRAQAHLGEWGAIGGMALQEANGFIAEAGARLQQDSAKYQWYGDQYAKLSAEYARGLAAIKGTAGGGGA